MRTADRLLAGKVEAHARNDPLIEMAQSVVKAGPVIVADNVFDFCADHRREEWVLETRFPTLAPPWPSFWVEWHNSGTQRRGVMVIDLHQLKDHAVEQSARRPRNLDHLDAMIRTEERTWRTQREIERDLRMTGDMLRDAKAELRRVELDRERAQARASLLELGILATQDAQEQSPEVAKYGWVVAMVLFVENAKEVQVPAGWMALCLDDMGGMLGNRWQVSPHYTDFDENRLMNTMVPVFQTIAFLHCRNVQTDRVIPPQKLSRNHERKTGSPLLRYHTLRLVVPRQASDGQARGPGSQKSLHIVSGHFAHYGDCCPGAHEPKGKLFGRLEGVYWMPMHARGNADRGTVKTDFELEVGA